MQWCNGANFQRQRLLVLQHILFRNIRFALAGNVPFACFNRPLIVSGLAAPHPLPQLCSRCFRCLFAHCHHHHHHHHHQQQQLPRQLFHQQRFRRLRFVPAVLSRPPADCVRGYVRWHQGRCHGEGRWMEPCYCGEAFCWVLCKCSGRGSFRFVSGINSTRSARRVVAKTFTTVWTRLHILMGKDLHCLLSLGDVVSSI
jgi:hypothetical protein